ncbi:MAG TPA: ABC transporter ATP-binding protein [Steroidobacteraceae bacterium]
MNEPAVRAAHLRKTFGSRAVLDDLTFDIQPGEVVGVLGKNGAGKTTLLEIMLGYTTPTSGHVRVFGRDSHALPGEIKRRVGYVPQQDELLNHLSVAEQLRVIASFHRHWDDELVARLCAAWGVDPRARIKSMSVGERQKLSILLAFGHRPDLLILDEPVASLDPVARRQFLEQLVEMSTERQRSIVFSTHIVSDIERLATRVWILKEGRLCWAGDLESLKESVSRLHIRGAGNAAAALEIPGVINQRAQGQSVIAVVRDWSPAIQQEFERRYSAEVTQEPLGLEEIFLELHR